MRETDEWHLGSARILALVDREAVATRLGHAPGCPVREDQLFELAILGWTEDAFICEAWDWSPDV
jgi:hypothetical protein